MDRKLGDYLYAIIVVGVTATSLIVLPIIPGYLRESKEGLLGLTTGNIVIFGVFSAITVGIAFALHRAYSSDYGLLRSKKFFVIFGGVTGAILGEVIPNASPVYVFMIIPYSILMLIYAIAYKRFAWWKVAMTSFLGGILIENGLNRAPLQAPTIMWIAFFTYPYFWAKLWENRQNVPVKLILKDLRWVVILSFVFAFLGYAVTTFPEDSRTSPPLIFLGFTLPYVLAVPVILRRTKKVV